MQDCALFPLNTVLFPGGRLPLRIFEQRYMEMAKACLRDDTPFGVCLIRDGAEVGAPATPVEIGCLARIAAWDMPQLGMLHIIARGEQRFRIHAPVPEQCKSCVRLLERVIAQQGDGLFEPPHRFDSSAWVSARLAEFLPLPLSAKQELFELTDARARLERLNNLLGR